MSVEAEYSSQNLPLLEASVSPITLTADASSQSEINIISDTAILPAVGPLGVSDGTDVILDSSDFETSVYVIRKGDSLSAIAKMFNVSVNTILWANDMKKGDPLKEGEVLVILPISGVQHTIQKGETLKGIAQKYKADILEVASFNGISVGATLSPGEELIIPDGEITIDGPVKTSSKGKTSPVINKDLSGYFTNPAPGAVKTQGLHGKNAVDLAAPIGTPIKAAASGRVLVARMGWNGGYGGLIIIQHPNGTKTLYAHLSGLSTSTGAEVSKGETIGYMGNSGHVRPSPGGNGSHLHFEVQGAKNPFR